MVERLNVYICVIGAGSGGLSVAAGAAMLGVPVALIERGKMGGDCLNYGCVPSKALLAAAKAAETVRRGARFGLIPREPEIDWEQVRGHVHGVIDDIAPHDSVARFEGLGVHVIAGQARFTGPTQVSVGDVTIDARRVVVAAGSSPLVPPVPGLADVPYLTNETIFDLDRQPEHLIVMGGGPIGLELAQAHRRLGAKVTVVEMFEVLGRDDRELARVVATRLRREGVDILEETEITAIERTASGIAIKAEGIGGERRIEGSHLLVAAGRRPNVDGLDLDAAGIRLNPQGIDVDARLRTSNRKVYAIGDIAGGLQFTHVAGHHAGIVVRNALFRLPAKYDATKVPRVTYTDPELAQVGLDEREARAAHGDIRVLRWPLSENDRARTEREEDGLVKAVTDRRGRILGASIVGPHAGETIQPWVLAIGKGMKIGAMQGLIAPYPTFGEASVRAASGYFAPSIFGPRARRLVRLLTRLG